MRSLLTRFCTATIVVVLLLILLGPVSIYAQIEELPPANCAITDYIIQGQANGSPVKTKEPPWESIIQDAASNVATAETLAEGGETPVVIIIVDDFSSYMPGANQTHGDVVEQVILSEIDNNPAITTEHLDIAQHDFLSGEVALELNTVIEDYHSQGVNNFVVNMSIAIIGCDPESVTQQGIQPFLTEFRDDNTQPSSKVNARNTGLFDIRQGEGPGLLGQLGAETLLGLLANPNGVNENRVSDLLLESRDALISSLDLGEEATNEDLINALSAQYSMDPLRLVGPVNNLIGQPNGDVQVVLVASAGNYGPGDPMYPARWPDFISVSAPADGVDEDAPIGGNGVPLEFGTLIQNDTYWSNNGEIAAFGGPSSAAPGYVGTSISAPYVSAAIAQVLTTGVSCSAHPVDDWEIFDNLGDIDCSPSP